MMNLYVLKCDGGYVRSSGPRKCACVVIEKATVFKEINLVELEALSKRAARAGLKNVHLVELKVIEKVYSDREEGLRQSLYEILNKEHGDLVEDQKKWEDILLKKLSHLGENDFVELAEQVRCKKLQP